MGHNERQRTAHTDNPAKPYNVGVIMLRFFSGVIILTDDQPRALAYGRIAWVNLFARTNAFTLVSGPDGIDGKRIANGGAVDVPAIPLPEPANSEQIQVKNTTAGANAVIEVFGYQVV